MNFRIVLFFALGVMLSTAEAQTAGKWPSESCGPQAAEFKAAKTSTVPGPSTGASGQAVIYVFQLDNNAHAPLVSHPVLRFGMDGLWVGATHGVSFVTFDAAAGQRHLCTSIQTDSTDLYNSVALNSLTVEPGKAYFFAARMYYGGRDDTETYVTLDPLPEDEGRFLLTQMPASRSSLKSRP